MCDSVEELASNSHAVTGNELQLDDRVENKLEKSENNNNNNNSKYTVLPVNCYLVA